MTVVPAYHGVLNVRDALRYCTLLIVPVTYWLALLVCQCQESESVDEFKSQETAATVRATGVIKPNETMPLQPPFSESTQMPSKAEETDSSNLANEIIQKNNSAVSMIREGRFVQAQTMLRSALIQLQSQVDDSIMMTPSIGPLDDWVAAPAHMDRVLQSHSSEDTSFFLYREGISIPHFSGNQQEKYQMSATYKAISFAVFFNQALAHHLCCSVISSPRKARKVASSAHMLYRIAMQYRNEGRSYSFVLAASNNLAVLDFKWNIAVPDTNSGNNSNNNNEEGGLFGFQRRLLVRSFLSQVSTAFTRRETSLRNRYWENVHRAEECIRLRHHAGAA
eukprot:scaffold733_cov97-Cylindrotheca_fusiformis.AAC.1